MKKTAFLSGLLLLIILPVSTQAMASNNTDNGDYNGLIYNTYNVVSSTPAPDGMTSNDDTINIANKHKGSVIGTLYIQYNLP